MMKRILLALTALSISVSATAQQAPPLDNRASDPRVMGWMQGLPVPADKQILLQDLSYWTFPKQRWSFSNMQSIVPTLPIRRSGPTRAIPYALRSDIDAISFTPMGGTKPMTWRESLDANYTDGIVVLHRGKIVYEYTFGAYDMSKVHMIASVTKSFIGLTATMLIREGKLNPSAPVTRYLPEMAGSGFADATVQQVLDMTTALDYSENYTAPSAGTMMYFRAGGLIHPPGYEGPKSTFAGLQAMGKKGDHGAGFTYRTPNSDLLGWIIARAAGKPLVQQLEERFWSKLGMESDANIWTDSTGAPFSGGGLSLHLRDLARFAEMLRNEGRVGKTVVVPADVIADIRKGADREKFKTGGYVTLPGWSYHNQFWISHDDHGVYMGRGIHGQMFYVNPKAELVIARFASHPIAGNMGIDPNSLPAWRALAEHMIKVPRERR
jgi:CubicO group peptidase (beta-lactamase class C family)